MNFGFIIDNRKCIGCHACTVACKAEHDVPIGVNRTWVKYIEKGEFPHTRRIFSVMRCNHCADAPCVEICPTTALYTRSDGIVDFDNRRCIGCKACTQACPYDALYIDPDSNTAAKCNYCAHRVDIGLEPACVNVCPEHAIISGDVDNPASEISQLLAREQVTARKTEKGTRPKLFYIEGDQAALNPTATSQSDGYMWSTQSAGVGHFAKYAESRISQAAQETPAEGEGSSVESTWVGETDATRVLVPAGGDQAKMIRQATEVVQENARRVYDAPGKGVLWGWQVSAYVWTKAIATGAFLIPFLASILGVTPSEGEALWLGSSIGLFFLILTLALLVLDLDQPGRFAYVLLRPQWSSWLVRGGYAITVYGGLLGLWMLSNLQGWHGTQALALWSGAAFAVITAIYTAFLFAQSKGRDFWQSPSLSMHMLVHALLAGAAVFALIPKLSGQLEWQSFLTTVFYIGIGVNLTVVAVELVTAHPTLDSQATVRMIVSGPMAKAFWLGTILVGNVIPLVMILSGGQALLAGAGVLLLIGIYTTEHIWVRTPQLIPLS